ncbi:MAG: 5'-nucleotidase C-terminal domain-containing protein, partial [Deltaproteobacteria bacterium]|nr:5'-nucleotidase C-terminal domain-containing protein [Deltaproteobacteria bacterium]
MRSLLWGLVLFQAAFVVHAQPASTQPATQPASTPSSAPTRSRQVHLLFTGDLYGRYAWPGCAERQQSHAELSHLISATRALRQRLSAAGKRKPITLMAGSAIRPDVLGNFIFRDAPALVPRVAELFSRVGFDAISVGLFDFGAAPEALARYERAMRKEGLALLAGNVRCRGSEDARCSGLGAEDGQRYQVIERGGLKVGIFAVVRGDLSKRILERSGHDLESIDPVRWSRATITTLRQREKVDLVVALANLNLESDAPGPVLEYLRALGHDSPDIVVANAMFERASRSGYLRQIRRGRTVVVGTDRFGQHLGEAVITLGKKGVHKVEVRQHAVAEYPPDKKAQPLLDTMIRELCRTTNQPLGKGVFTKPMRYKGALEYLMQVMRKRTRAEVAVLNDSAIADTSFPMKGQLTNEQLLRAIRSETPVGHVSILGKQLIKHFGKHVTKGGTGLNVLGMKKKGKKWRVNGRPLVAGQLYRVAITAFVAAGGDGLIKLKPLETFDGSGTSLRAMTLAFFGADEQAEHDQNSDIDLSKDFPDLGDRWVLYGDFDLGFSLSKVSISNGPATSRYSL